MPAPLDLHAHVSPETSARDAQRLGAFIFAATRSIAEFDTLSNRRDLRMVWGVGVHPGLVRSQKGYTEGSFVSAIGTTPMVSEVGLDAGSRVPMATQLSVFRSVLGVLEQTPRLVSVHSAGAQIQVLRELARHPAPGVVLHWWTGSKDLTAEAVRLGCYFSLPPAAMGDLDTLSVIPLDRLLPETDHPAGDRFGPQPRRPGNLKEVETRLAASRGLDRYAMRIAFWRNLAQLVNLTDTADLFGSAWTEVFRQVQN